MGACSSSPNSKRVASRDDLEEQPRPIDPTEQPGKVAEIIYNSMRAKPKAANTNTVSPTNTSSPTTDRRPSLRVLVPPGTLSSRARHSSRNITSKKTQNKRENMFDLSGLNDPPQPVDTNPSPRTPAAPTSPETPTSTGSRRLAFVQTVAEGENSLQRENSVGGSARPTHARKFSVTVSRVEDSDSDEETNGEPAELSHSIRMQKGRHSRNVSVGNGMIEPVTVDGNSSTPRPLRMVDSPRVHGSPLTGSPRTLGFSGTHSPDSTKRRIKDMPFAQQVLQRQFEGTLETDFSPAPYKSVTDTSLLDSRRGMIVDMSTLEEDEEEENNDKLTDITSSPAVHSTPTRTKSTPTQGSMTRHISSTKTEKLWAHYAGKENKHMYKKGLRQLSDDVYDEFVQRYKKKLFDINTAAYEKKGQVYSDEQAERDLAVDLPILLPVANKKATRDDFVKFVYSFLFHEMNKPSSSKGPDSEISLHRSSTSISNHSHGDPKLSKIQFVLGWNHAQEVLFQIIDRIQPEEKNQSPCKLM